MGTDATLCFKCGGPFAAKRIYIGEQPYHERCAIMSYPDHTPEHMARSSRHAFLAGRSSILDKLKNPSDAVLDAIIGKPGVVRDIFEVSRDIALALEADTTKGEGK